MSINLMALEKKCSKIPDIEIYTKNIKEEHMSMNESFNVQEVNLYEYIDDDKSNFAGESLETITELHK